MGLLSTYSSYIFRWPVLLVSILIFAVGYIIYWNRAVEKSWYGVFKTGLYSSIISVLWISIEFFLIKKSGLLGPCTEWCGIDNLITFYIVAIPGVICLIGTGIIFTYRKSKERMENTAPASMNSPEKSMAPFALLWMIMLGVAIYFIFTTGDVHFVPAFILMLIGPMLPKRSSIRRWVIYLGAFVFFSTLFFQWAGSRLYIGPGRLLIVSLVGTVFEILLIKKYAWRPVEV